MKVLREFYYTGKRIFQFGERAFAIANCEVINEERNDYGGYYEERDTIQNQDGMTAIVRIKKQEGYTSIEIDGSKEYWISFPSRFRRVWKKVTQNQAQYMCRKLGYDWPF
jgi:hypothetical protein